MNEHTVLLVEDNPNDVDLTLMAFKEIGFSHKVVVARDGVEALDILFGRGNYAGRRKPPLPVLIVLDLKLPKLNGFEVLREIRSDPHLRYISVAILTSSNEERDRTEALDLGANLYLRKAVDFDEFLTVVKRIETLISAVK